MKIKSQKDFYSGVVYAAVGVAFAWGATNYTLGEGARMGRLCTNARSGLPVT